MAVDLSSQGSSFAHILKWLQLLSKRNALQDLTTKPQFGLDMVVRVCPVNTQI